MDIYISQGLKLTCWLNPINHWMCCHLMWVCSSPEANTNILTDQIALEKAWMYSNFIQYKIIISAAVSALENFLFGRRGKTWFSNISERMESEQYVWNEHWAQLLEGVEICAFAWATPNTQVLIWYYWIQLNSTLNVAITIYNKATRHGERAVCAVS